MSILLAVVLLLVCASGSNAQGILAGYDFSVNTEPTASGACVVASDITLGAGAPTLAVIDVVGDNTGVAASGTPFGSVANGSLGATNPGLGGGNLAFALADDQYFSFSLNTAPGDTLNLSGFSIDTAISDNFGRSESRAANEFNVLAQVNGGSAWVATSALVADQITLSPAGQAGTTWQSLFIPLAGNAAFQGINSVEFRVYLWGGAGGAANSRTNFDNILVEGTVDKPVVPPPPTPPAPPVIPPPPPIIGVVDSDAIGQLLASAVPMNMAIGQVAFNVHNVGGRSFNRRISRLRQRHVDYDSLDRRRLYEKEISISRVSKLTGGLNVTNTIDLTGKSIDIPNGQESNSELIFSDESPFVPYVTQKAHHSMDPDVLASGENWSVHASADFGQYDLDPISGASGLRSNTYASTAGVEYIFNQHWAGGLGWSHVWNDNTLRNGLGSFDIEGDTAMAYLSYFKNNFWGDLFYSYGDYEVDINRNTLLGSTVTAAPDLESHQATLNLGYNILRDRVVHGPTFRADYGWGHLDGYTEQGDLRANTRFSDQRYESLITTLGWQVNWEVDTTFRAKMRPNFRLGYGRENIDQETNVSGTLQQSPFATVNTGTGAIVGRGARVTNGLRQVDPGEGWMELGAGVAFDFNNRFGLYFDYQARFFQEDAQLHLGTVKASMRW